MSLAKWKCHKVVASGLIEAINPGGATDGFVLSVRQADGSLADTPVPAEIFARGAPEPGQAYLVDYQDGYRSWSPKKAFEEGYTRIEEKQS